MKIAERLLLLLSKSPLQSNQENKKGEWDFDNSLSILCEVFPEFLTAINGKEIIDFGCGSGYQAVAFALNGAKFVLGVEICPNALNKAKEKAKNNSLENKVAFTNRIGEQHKNKFDIIISQNSIEHFSDPVAILNEMKSVLRKDGLLFVTFGPPWLAPYGSHMQFFTSVPWVNIFFNEKTVMNVRTKFWNDGAKKYENVEGGLNKMTVNKFEKIITKCNMKIKFKRYDCVKNLNLLGKFPYIREFFINRVSCILVNL